MSLKIQQEAVSVTGEMRAFILVAEDAAQSLWLCWWFGKEGCRYCIIAATATQTFVTAEVGVE